ncbi:MAG: phosphoribosyltransferase [Spirochaetota bacterium]
MDHLYISPDLFSKLAHRVIKQIKESGKTYDYILCPLRGGFFLSYVVNNHLKIPIKYLEISSYLEKEQHDFMIGIKPDLQHGRYLLCDDIYDSGKTIQKIKEMYSDIDMDVACLLTKQPVDNFYVGEYIDDERWVDFFWEIL